MHLKPAYCLLALAFAPCAPAQNLALNGDFEAPMLAPWTVVNFAIDPGVETFNTSGTSMSRCYATTPGLPAALGDPHVIEQQVTLVAGVTYEVRYDVEATYRSAGGGAPLDVFVQVGSEFDLPAVLPQSLNLLQPEFRLHRAGLFTASAGGQFSLRVGFRFEGTASSTSPRVRVDNVDIRRSRQPFIGQFEMQRRINFGNTLTIRGAPDSQYFLFFSFELANPPIPIPSISGELRLGPRGLRSIRTGTFDGLGTGTLVFLVPNNPNLIGLPVYWQALQFDASRGIADLGWETTQGFR